MSRQSQGARTRGRDDVPTLEGVLRSGFREVAGLADEEHPVEAEIAASALIASWERAELDGVPDVPAFFGLAMVDFLRRRETPDAYALLCGLAAVGHRPVAAAARRAIPELRGAGVVPPRWASSFERLTLIAAWLATDDLGDGDVLVGRYAYGTDDPYDLVVLVDHNMAAAAKDVGIALPDAGMRSFWETQERVVVRDLAPGEYAALLARALGAATLWDPRELAEGARTLGPLARSRLRQLPKPAPGPRAPHRSAAARKRLYGAFRASREGAALGRSTILAHEVIGFAADFNGDATRWSPVVVEICMLDAFPRDLDALPWEIGAMPDVLRAWIRFAAARRGLVAEALEETLAAVDQHESEFLEAMHDRSRFGPRKALSIAMDEDGVDTDDATAVSAWLERFEALSEDERMARLFGSHAGPVPRTATRT